MIDSISTAEIDVGVVGLGLMGTSIVVSLLLSGHSVKAIAPISSDMGLAQQRIYDQLEHCSTFGLLRRPTSEYLARLTISEDYKMLKNCQLVMECVIEDLEIKKSVYTMIVSWVAAETVIATNTSAIPISMLQNYVAHRERFLGIHWSEPAYATPFLEITCGDFSSSKYCEWVYELAHCWAKEPTLLRKDIRGFITNRLMYAVYREALFLYENKEASLEDIDKAFRYDVGSWITLMGIFRRMDMIGLKDYKVIFETVFERLSNHDRVPDLMQLMVNNNARGLHNLNGLYPYTEEQAKQWEKAFARFNKDIYHLAHAYGLKKSSHLKKEGQTVHKL